MLAPMVPPVVVEPPMVPPADLALLPPAAAPPALAALAAEFVPPAPGQLSAFDGPGHASALPLQYSEAPISGAEPQGTTCLAISWVNTPAKTALFSGDAAMEALVLMLTVAPLSIAGVLAAVS